jgi:dTDP-4-dehydrorhamnose reductase
MKKNSILVIGAKGQLGWELVRQGETEEGGVVGIDIDELDITHQTAVQAYFKKQTFSVVVNAAAYTAVDQAEKESATAFAVNSAGPNNLAILCHEKSIPLVHISTDYVFDGLRPGAYREDDLPSPVGIYAQSKAEGEKRIAAVARRYMIIRTAWLYGVHGNNFVKSMLRLGRERTELKVVDDQHGCPTNAAGLAAAILSICRKVCESKKFNAWGVYHYCDKGETTWYGFAEMIFKIASRHETLALQELIPITTQEYPTPAKRPPNSVLSCDKIQQTFGIRRKAWEKSLEEMMRRYYENLGLRTKSQF